MNLLITGSSGYIGSSLVKKLDIKKNKIFLVSLNKKTHIHFKKNFAIVNYYDFFQINKILKKIDVVIHCAAMNSINCNENPLSCNKFNYEYTKSLFKLSNKNKVKKFLFLSSIHVYKSLLKGSITNKTRRMNHIPYAISKIKAENYLKKNNIKNSTVFILRISNIYGPPISNKILFSNLFINDFCKNAVQKKEIVIKSNKNIYRNILSIANLTKIISKIIYMNNKKSLEIINIGSQISETLEYFALLISERCFLKCGFKPKIILQNKDSAKYLPLSFDISLLKNKYKFKKENTESEIDKLLIYYLKRKIN